MSSLAQFDFSLILLSLETTWEFNREELSNFNFHKQQLAVREQFSKWQVAWKARYCYRLIVVGYFSPCTQKHHEILIFEITLSPTHFIKEITGDHTSCDILQHFFLINWILIKWKKNEKMTKIIRETWV
jgi:hypothetical protein